MTARTDRRREFSRQQAQAILRAITPTRDQQQLRERAAALARHGNDDQQIAIELGVGKEVVRRWLAEAAST